MPSVMLQNFNGGFYTARMPILGSDQAINIYTETREVKGSSKQKWMYGTPGLDVLLTVGTTVSRGMFTQDGQTWAVIGSHLYELNLTAATATDLGAVPDDGAPVSFACNGDAGRQLAIVGASALSVLDLDTNGLSTVALPFVDPVMIVFQDGYGLINQRNTPTFWFSALEDFTTWDALDFVTRSGTSDDLIGVSVTRDRVWAIGSKTTTQYYDSGDADNPWAPYPGTTIQVGSVAWTTITTYNDVLRWIGVSPRGEPRVIQVTADSRVQTFSTPPITDVLAACSTLDDAEALIYEQAGHPFYVMTLPSSPADVQTYHFDILENEWGARAGYDEAAGQFRRWRARGVTAADQMVIVGDYANGNIYTLDLEAYTDNDVTLVRERIAPFLFPSENQWITLSEAELACQNGVGLASGAAEDTDPVVELYINRDGGQTWVSAGTASLGASGVYTARTIWHRLCRIRSDRALVKLRQTAAVKCAWYGLWVNAESGTGQL